jgi:hypothetical protein
MTFGCTSRERQTARWNCNSQEFLLFAQREISSCRFNGDNNWLMAQFSKKSVEKRKEKNPAAVALGRLGGLKGGPATAKKLSREQRQANARKAITARWAKTGSQTETVISKSDLGFYFITPIQWMP